MQIHVYSDDLYLLYMAHIDDLVPTTAYRSWSLHVVSEPVLEVFWREKDSTVLLHKLGEVAEERMLFTEKVKLIVPLLSHHQLV